MGQTFTDDCFAGTHVAQTDMQNIETNFATLKSCFSGTGAPSNPVAGMQYYETDQDLIWHRNAANGAWKAVSFPSGTVILFGQASAPVGYTKKVSWTDNAMLCINTQANGTTLGASGSANPQSGHAHTATAHTHPGGSSHYHKWYEFTDPYNNAKDGAGNSITHYESQGVLLNLAFAIQNDNREAINMDCYTNTVADSTTGSGGAVATADNTAPLYQEVIAATKD